MLRENYFVSVAMTSYNGEKYISEQIDSILINLLDNDELIINDDGSTDNTLNIIKQYTEKDKRIKLFQNNHLGINKNIEDAILKCTGKYIFIADQDDVWLDNKITTICSIFDNDNNVDLVFHNSKVSNTEIADIKHENLFETLAVSNKFSKNIIYYHFWGCMFAIRKTSLQYLVPFKFDFDNWIIFCCSFLKKCTITNEILMTYRRHNDNVSTFKRGKYISTIIKHMFKFFKFLLYSPILLHKYRKVSEK